jgi:hypothetical protein
LRGVAFAGFIDSANAKHCNMGQLCTCGAKPIPRFEDYAAQNCILNEFKFYVEAMQFQRQKHKGLKDKRQKARTIVDTYLDDSSLYCIVLSKSTLQNIPE